MNKSDQPITKNEAFRTISSMKLNKSDGYDCLPLEFYTVFWNDISDLLLNSFNYSLDNGLYHFLKEMVLLRSSLKKIKIRLKSKIIGQFRYFLLITK